MDACTVNTIKGRAPLRASQVIRAAMAARGKGGGALHYVYAPKVNRDCVLTSDLEFLKFLQLEGDEEVVSYETDIDRIVTSLGDDGYVGTVPDAIVQFRDGRRRMVEVKYSQDLKQDLRAQLQVRAQSEAAEAQGMEWKVFTELDAIRQERFLNDWLQIVVNLSYAKETQLPALTKLVANEVTKLHRVTLGDLKAMEVDSWHLVFPAVFYLVQSGLLTSDLRVNALSAFTVVAPRM